jgi:hypothetical protein
MATILCNTIAMAMFDASHPHSVQMHPIQEHEAISLLSNGFVQAVGHPATAEVLALRTGLDIKFNRMNVCLSNDDILIIAQVVVPRLAEGQVLSKS